MPMAELLAVAVWFVITAVGFVGAVLVLSWINYVAALEYERRRLKRRSW